MKRSERVRMTFLGGAAETLTKDGKCGNMLTRRSQGTVGGIKSRQRGGGQTREILDKFLPFAYLDGSSVWLF